jgi:predicted CXXCH cytochrome family protein
MPSRPIRAIPWVLRALVVAVAVGLAPSASAQTQAAADACVTCHAMLDARLSAPATNFSAADVHRASGFHCTDCHGGDGSSADKARGHDPARGFRGKPAGQAVVTTCARCHSDAELMRRFAPRQRVDQAAEYATSVHGKQLAQNDTRVATCASCHGSHGIRAVNDVQSPVYPLNVAATCARCHADQQHMSGYKLPNGSPLPTNQLSEYQKSVHNAALTKGADLSAPTCNDCHGNHGAAPPGVGSVVNVCGTCHAVFAQKFATSVHAEIFDKACVECHGNHAVLKPSDEMVGADAPAICATCHSGADDKGAAAAAAMRRDIDRLRTGIERSAALISRVSNAGMEVSAQELALAGARSRLTLARTELHTFEPARMEPVVAEGLTIVAGVDAAGSEAVAELRYRRRGLVASLGAILLVIVALGLKIRQIERRAPPHA